MVGTAIFERYVIYTKSGNLQTTDYNILIGWLQQDSDRAYCSVCKLSLRAHKTDLVNHSKKQKHKLNYSKNKPVGSQTTLTNIKVISNDTKRSELIIAAFIAVHSSIKVVDHLSDMLNKEFRPVKSVSGSSDIKIHRTKCSMLVQNVIGATLKEQLVADIGDSSNYSLIIDESTDVSVHKYLCLCIRYIQSIYLKYKIN